MHRPCRELQLATLAGNTWPCFDDRAGMWYISDRVQRLLVVCDMDKALVSAFTDELISESFSRILEYFQDVGTPTPETIWSPAQADLEEEVLQVLLAYWSGLPRGRNLPLACTVDPLEMRKALGYVMLLDVEDDGWDYRYRVYGTSIAERSGFDATGKLLSDLALHPMEPFFLASYRACVLQSEFMFARHQPPLRVHTTRWDRIILPLEDGEGSINRLLVGNVPGAWQAERSFEA